MREMGRVACGLLFLFAVAVEAEQVRGDEVRWLHEPQAALRQSAATGRPVLMKFTADWCGPCRRMERETFSDPETVEVIHERFIPVKIDADKNEALCQELKIKGLPALLIVAPDLTIVERITGFQTSARLLPKLNAARVAQKPAPRVPALPAAQERTAAPAPETNPFEQNPFFEQQPELPTAPAPTPASARAGSFEEMFGTPAEPPAAAAPSFGGLCLPSVVDHRQLIPGSTEFSAEYRGQLLHFRDAAQRDQFFRTPEKYWPVLDGLCAVTLLETGDQVAGELQHAAVFRNQIWVFRTQQLMERFIESPSAIAQQVEAQQKRTKTAGRSY